MHVNCSLTNFDFFTNFQSCSSAVIEFRWVVLVLGTDVLFLLLALIELAALVACCCYICHKRRKYTVSALRG